MKLFPTLGMILLITSLIACSNLATTVPTQSSTHETERVNESIETINRISDPSKSLQKAKSINQFTAAPDRDLFTLAQELWSNSRSIPQIITQDSGTYSVGHSEIFWLIDLPNTKMYQSYFTIALVTPNAYWYIEDNTDISIAALERSAARFEKDTYPMITQIFGTAWPSEVDSDNRLNILNARLEDVAGYYNSADEYPKKIRSKSNQRKIIYVNAYEVSPGTINYDRILSHELLHAILWNADNSEDTWINEGLAELASSITLRSSFPIRQFERNGPISLVHWPTSTADTMPNYGAASLFMHFFTEHYGGLDSLRDFMAQPKDGISGINQYLDENGYKEDFDDIFKQWAVANILDQHLLAGSRILHYDRLKVRAAVPNNIVGLKDHRSEIPQYAVEYTELKSILEPFQISFRGNEQVPLLPVDIGPLGCWWSNSGDSIDSTLSHHIGVPTSSTPVLKYEVWFDIEKDWDYLYVEVSIDNEETWQIIETLKTSAKNPFGNAFGEGYTGRSGGWLVDSVDLTPFSHEDLWVRFQYVTDDAINGAGACFRNISLSGTELTPNTEVWIPKGFTFVDNAVRQDFQVQLIKIGDKPQVRELPIDSRNTGKLTVLPPKDGERLILAVASLAEKTRELAKYTVTLTAQH